MENSILKVLYPGIWMMLLAKYIQTYCMMTRWCQGEPLNRHLKCNRHGIRQNMVTTFSGHFKLRPCQHFLWTMHALNMLSPIKILNVACMLSPKQHADIILNVALMVFWPTWWQNLNIIFNIAHMFIICWKDLHASNIQSGVTILSACCRRQHGTMSSVTQC